MLSDWTKEEEERMSSGRCKCGTVLREPQDVGHDLAKALKFAVQLSVTPNASYPAAWGWLSGATFSLAAELEGKCTSCARRDTSVLNPRPVKLAKVGI